MYHENETRDGIPGQYFWSFAVDFFFVIIINPESVIDHSEIQIRP